MFYLGHGSRLIVNRKAAEHAKSHPPEQPNLR